MLCARAAAGGLRCVRGRQAKGRDARRGVSQGLTTGFWLPGERPTQPSRPQAPPRPLGEPQMPGRGLSQNNSDNVAFL